VNLILLIILIVLLCGNGAWTYSSGVGWPQGTLGLVLLVLLILVLLGRI
jgi:hypothetical protein